MDAAIEYATTTMREAGFDKVWTEPVLVPHWERGQEWARLTAPFEQKLDILGLGASVGTPPEGIEAEVLVVSGDEELSRRSAEAKGKIVLFFPQWQGYGSVVKYRGAGASLAAKHGALAALVRSATNVSLGTPHTGIMRYEDDIPQIPAAAVTVEDAARMDRLTKRGVTVKVRLMMEAKNLDAREQSNVIAELAGRELPDEIVLVGGHLDSWDVGTGAHDDGTGCAIMLGAVHLLHSLGLRPRRTIRVVLFDSEEQGGYGGRAYKEEHLGELDDHVAALESDSGGFAPIGFSVHADDTVIDRVKAYAASLRAIGADGVEEGWAGVDIGPIVELGVPGIGHRVHGDHYFDVHHSPADTFDKVIPEELAANVAAAATLMWAIAEEGLPQRQPE
jgi:carboxypeptidase Q